MLLPMSAVPFSFALLKQGTNLKFPWKQIHSFHFQCLCLHSIEILTHRNFDTYTTFSVVVIVENKSRGESTRAPTRAPQLDAQMGLWHQTVMLSL